MSQREEKGRSTGRFLALRDEFCELAGQRAPALEPDAAGTLAFHQVLAPYTVTLTYAPHLSDDDLFLMMDLGEMTANETTWRLLMQLNTLAFGKNSPVLGLSDAGHLVIQKVYPLAGGSGRELHAIVRDLVNWAQRWHAGHWLPTQLAHPDPAPFTEAMAGGLA